MASPIEITGAIIQYAFIDRVNTVSKKFSFSALIPWDENCHQCQSIINASNAEWAKVSAGAKKAQSMGYMILAATDAAHIHPDVMKMLDPNRYYLQVRPVQDENTTTPIALYDTVPNLIGNRSIVGNGTIGNYKAVAYGYDSAGQKGVKYYAQWLQITNLVENTNSNTGPAAAGTPGGYVADAAALTPPPVMQQQPIVQQQTMPAANVMPSAPTTIPGVQTYAAPAVNVMPQPQVAAPVAQPVYQDPNAQYAQPATVAQPTYAAPVAPVAAAPVAQPAYAAPVAPVAAAPVAQPAYTAPAAPAPVAQVAPVAAAPVPAYTAPVMPVAAPVMPAN